MEDIFPNAIWTKNSNNHIALPVTASSSKDPVPKTNDDEECSKKATSTSSSSTASPKAGEEQEPPKDEEVSVQNRTSEAKVISEAKVSHHDLHPYYDHCKIWAYAVVNDDDDIIFAYL